MRSDNVTLYLWELSLNINWLSGCALVDNKHGHGFEP